MPPPPPTPIQIRPCPYVAGGHYIHPPGGGGSVYLSVSAADGEPWRPYLTSNPSKTEQQNFK